MMPVSKYIYKIVNDRATVNANIEKKRSLLALALVLAKRKQCVSLPVQPTFIHVKVTAQGGNCQHLNLI